MAAVHSLDVAGILELAGADDQAVPGSQGWALAQVARQFSTLVGALEVIREHIADERLTSADRVAVSALATVRGGIRA